MSVNKIVTKVDGVENKTIDFNDLKAGLSAGAHTVTVEAYNGATLVSTQTKNVTIAAAGDTTAPTITTATVEDANPDKLVVVFSEVVTITNTTGLTIAGAATPTLSAPTGSGSNTITFTLSAALTNGQSVTLNVDSSNTIEDAANNALAATTKAITNNVAAVAFEPELQQFLTATSINDSTISSALNTYIKDLKSNSLWDKIEALYPIVGDTANKHSYNLKNSNTYQITWFGSGIHTVNGFTGNSTNGYGNTGFVETRDADNSSFVLVRTSNTTNPGVEIGAVTSNNSSGSHIYTKFGDLNTILVRNQSPSYDSLTGTSPNGWMATSRLNNTNYIIQKNDVSETFTRTGSSEICPFEYYVAARNKGGVAETFSADQSVTYGLGKGLTIAELSILRALTLQLQTNLGR